MGYVWYVVVGVISGGIKGTGVSVPSFSLNLVPASDYMGC